MTKINDRIGAVCVGLGFALVGAYAALFLVLLPVDDPTVEYSQLVSSPYWRALALVALVGVISILAGLDVIYLRLGGSAGVGATVGLLLTKVALVLQASVLTWELFLDPVIASRPDSAFLLREMVIAQQPGMVIFRWLFLGTMVFGALTFGAAIYRSNEFPKSAIALIVSGAALYGLGSVVSHFLAACGVLMSAGGGVLIGVRLWSRPVEANRV